MKHRNDIDGLRALAVAPIVLFHAGVVSLSGGFIGVDIFFVISGYLITSIIIKDIENDDFSIVRFYHRRVVRILPALTVLLAFVLLYGAIFLLPVELETLTSASMAAMTFVSNMYFWMDADYFAGSSESKPLLHTWSLGVEEQFYVFYPLFLLLLNRYFPSKIRSIVLGVTLGSFLICVALTFKFPTTAFYLLPARAWELGIGALVALRFFPALPAKPARNLASIAGFGMILAAIVVTDPTWGFPGPSALLPCLGAALLIAYGDGAPTARILELPFVRWIGAISYSLYLWHWPIITFYRLQFGTHLDSSATVLLVALSILAAALSYYLVEQPFLRRFRSGVPRVSLAAGATAIVGAVVASLAIGAKSDAFVSFPTEVRRVASFANYRELPEFTTQFRRGPCFIGEGMQFDRETCLAMSTDKTNVILLGDSHAAQYSRALTDRFPDHNIMQATASGCRPTKALQGAARCTEIVDHVLRDAALRPGVSGVVIGGQWRPEDVASLAETIRDLRKAGLKVTVFGPTVEYDGEMPLLLARAMLQGTPDNVAKFRLASRERLDEQMASVVTAAGGRYVSEVALECPNGRCLVFDAAGGPFHFDYGHLTLEASRHIVDRMGPLL